jgi:formylglycine-generating enzyme required for sulfatase activity
MKRLLSGRIGLLAMLFSTLACGIATPTAGSTPAPQEPESTRIVQSPQPSAITPLPTRTPAPTQNLPIPTPTLGSGSIKPSTTDGMLQVFVPAGEFIMGSDSYDAIMSAPVSLEAFWIDQTEVTNDLFAKFISATHYRTDAETRGYAYVYQISSGDDAKTSGANWQHPHGPGSDLKGLEQYPVVQVSWNDATAYCQWAGRRLPTEAEWEKAARGTDGRLYPWGNQAWAGNLANLMDRQLNPTYTVDDGHAGIAPVGSYPDGISPYGALDMIGNGMEWVADWYADPYPQSDQTTTVVNPQGPASGDSRVMRGGNWHTNNDNDGEYRLASHRNKNLPDLSADEAGFRCASSQ